jgi:hypothetical protein
MLDQHLSRWGKRVAFVMVAVGGLYAFWAAVNQTGLARPVIAFQLRILGVFSPKMTGTVLLIPAVLGGYACGFLFDFVTRQGAFKSRADSEQRFGENCDDPFNPATFGQIRKVRIVAVPPGEAPESVRKAWVGLELPIISGGTSGPREVKAHGVLSGPKNVAETVARALNGEVSHTERGFVVDAATAVDILAQKSPDAARWWEENVPHSLQRGRKFVFAAHVCKEV